MENIAKSSFNPLAFPANWRPGKNIVYFMASMGVIWGVSLAIASIL